MPTYKVISNETGEEVYRYVSEQPVEWVGMEFANFLHVEVVAQVSNTVVQIFTWTPLEFLRRLNASERIATRTRAKTDPIVEDFMDLLDRASEVRSDDADVTNGLKYLWAVGILQTGRVGEITGAVNG